jgi:hypothetical protein
MIAGGEIAARPTHYRWIQSFYQIYDLVVEIISLPNPSINAFVQVLNEMTVDVGVYLPDDSR